MTECMSLVKLGEINVKVARLSIKSRSWHAKDCTMSYSYSVHHHFLRELKLLNNYLTKCCELLAMCGGG